MPTYDVHALCPECGQFHDVGLRVKIDESFEVYDLDDAYKDGLLSRDVLSDVKHVMCPNMERQFDIPPPHQLILVAARDAA